MKLDLDLLRAILLAVEASPDARPRGDDLLPAGVDWSRFLEHVRLLVEAGLLDASEMTESSKGTTIGPTRLTWSGHEFLGVARDDTVWKRGMVIAGRFNYEVLKGVLVKVTTAFIAPTLVALATSGH